MNAPLNLSAYDALDQWVDAHFDEQVRFLQELVRVPTDTPPGNNTPHALRTRDLLAGFGYAAQAHEVPANVVQAHGLQSITNLVVQRRYGSGGRIVALNAHGDVVRICGEGRAIKRAISRGRCDHSDFWQGKANLLRRCGEAHHHTCLAAQRIK